MSFFCLKNAGSNLQLSSSWSDTKFFSYPSVKNTWSDSSSWSRKQSGGDSPEGGSRVPAHPPQLNKAGCQVCRVFQMSLSWQQRSCGSEGIRNSPALSLTGSCETFHANRRLINAGLYNSGSMCGKEWTKMTTCNFCWILCKASFVAIRIWSLAVLVSDMLAINYCSKPEWKLMCGWDMQIEGQRTQGLRGSSTAWPPCSGHTCRKSWWRNLP